MKERQRKKRQAKERAEGSVRRGRKAGSLERESSLCERSESAIARSKVKKQAREKRAQKEGEQRGDREVRDNRRQRESKIDR